MMNWKTPNNINKIFNNVEQTLMTVQRLYSHKVKEQENKLFIRNFKQKNNCFTNKKTLLPTSSVIKYSFEVLCIHQSTKSNRQLFT